jgi:hypothetical protein
MIPLHIWFGDTVQATSGVDLQITIPAALAMEWDPLITTASLGGSASTKFASGVSFSPDHKTVKIPVNANTVDGDELIVSALHFTNFTAVSTAIAYLTVDVNNDGTADLTDGNEKYIIRSGGNATVYGGGFGSGWGTVDSEVLLGPTMFSAAAQLLRQNDAATPITPITFYFGGGQIPTMASGLKITIPSSLDCLWDTSVLAVSLSGSAAGKFATTVQYSTNAKVLTIPVTGVLAEGDSLIVSDLGLTSFGQQSSTLSYLTADTNNDGTADLTDLTEKAIIRANSASSVFGGGANDGWYELNFDAYVGQMVQIMGGLRIEGDVQIR